MNLKKKTVALMPQNHLNLKEKNLTRKKKKICIITAGFKMIICIYF